MENIYAEIITIGDEILYGQITDTNSQWISSELDKIGIRIIRKVSVGDVREEIEKSFKEAEARADIIIITGGLGPTKDDITKKTIANYVNAGMIMNEDVLENIRNIFDKKNREVNKLNRGQALVPDKATVLMNPVGTAPGMWIEHNNKVFISLPGVPHEMKRILTDSGLPKLREKYKTPFIYHKMIKTIGIGESLLAPKIEAWEDSLPENIKLAYLPRAGQVRLRLTGTSMNKEQIIDDVEKVALELNKYIKEFIYAFDDEEIEVTIGRLLKEKQLTLATAESCTGGRVADKITDIPGCSAYYMGGIVSYSNAVKMSQLGVKESTLKEYGAVSEQTAREMAENVRVKYGADFGISTTGIAGPDGGVPGKPVGTIYIALASPDETQVKLLNLDTERLINIQRTYSAVLEILRQKLMVS
ncbi:competence/damage-inducible protein A [Chondrinema litorale]|uniref:competence/damage-inducible protein A n=1 Tax=Chondrinema litorale TaxID=2994555 RepID=UPI002542B363|nr:competence/damage-inducible protein A [Chondrinema litorale]UZR94476.1 competence/damage-inducible protein A [Chondrinema litorale]